MSCGVGLSPSVAVTQVTTGWSTWKKVATDALTNTNKAFDNWSNLALTPTKVNVSWSLPSKLSTPFTKPTVPAAPSVSYSSPSAPGEPNIGDIGKPVLQALAITAPAEAPGVNFPSAPTPLTASAPKDAPTTGDYALPDAPTLAMPDDPALLNIVLPDAPTFTPPTLMASAPTTDGIVTPTNTFSFVEEVYTSTNLDSLNDRVAELLAGGTGMPDDVWRALWEKNTEREDENGQLAIDEVNNEWAARGFSLPQGAQTARVDKVRQEVMRAKNAASREIAIQQAQQEIENIRFAVAQAITLEDSLQGAHLQRQARALQAEQIAVEIGINLYNARVQLFTATVQAFNASIEQYKAQLQGEIQELEAHRLEIDAARVKGELNRQTIELYAQKLQALNTQVDLYRNRVQAVSSLVDIDKSKIDIFRTRVEAYGEEVRAKTSEFQAYSEQVRAEMSKVGVYDAQVRAYAEQVNAWKTKTEGDISIARLEYDAQRMQLDKYVAKLEKFKAEVASESARVSAGATIYDAMSRMYGSELAAESARVATEDKQFALALEQADKQYNLELKKTELNINQALRIAELEREELKTTASVQSSLSAAAMAAVNLSASIGSSDTNSASCSETYNY